MHQDLQTNEPKASIVTSTNALHWMFSFRTITIVRTIVHCVLQVFGGSVVSPWHDSSGCALEVARGQRVLPKNSRSEHKRLKFMAVDTAVWDRLARRARLGFGHRRMHGHDSAALTKGLGCFFGTRCFNTWRLNFQHLHWRQLKGSP